LLGRLQHRPKLLQLEQNLFAKVPEIGSVTEIYGKEGTGKTQFLISLMADCIIPTSWQGVALKGLNTEVVYIDTDFHFSLMRLVGVLECRIKACLQTNANNTAFDIDECINGCLQRLHIVRCHSSLQLLIALHSLEEMLKKMPQMSVLIIDSISAFYWLDRLAHLDAISSKSSSTRFNQIAAILTQLTADNNLLTFVSKAAMMTRREGGKDNSNIAVDGQMPVHFEYMGQNWQSCVNNRLIFCKHSRCHLCASGNSTHSVHEELFSVTVDKGSLQLQKAVATFNIGASGLTYL
jgi:DNA-repair protein XRCC2